MVPGRGRRAHVDLIRGRDGVVTDGGMVGGGVVGVRGGRGYVVFSWLLTPLISTNLISHSQQHATTRHTVAK